MKEAKKKPILTTRSITKVYDELPSEIKKYFEHLPKLIEEFPLEVVLSYLFTKLEVAQNNTIYCGIVKLHKTDSVLTRSAIEKWHITRDGFQEKCKVVFSKQIPKQAYSYIKSAGSVRDDIMHGKSVSDQKKRAAITIVLLYAILFNNFVEKQAGFKPFSNLKGFKGRAKTLDKSTSRWILKGMDFDIK